MTYFLNRIDPVSPQAAASVAVVISLVGQNAGAAFAKSLFSYVGVYGVASLRIGLAAALLLAFLRPWRRLPARHALRTLVCYGAMLGIMNLSIYSAFERLPIGIAVAIEVLGPLSVVLWASRTRRDFVWLAAATVGLGLLVPLHTDAFLDPVGVAFAFAAATSWAIYIIFGKRVSLELGKDAVAWGMLVALVLSVPIGASTAGATLLHPWVLSVGIIVATLSSALPYSLELSAMRHLPAKVMGLLLSSAPAVAALAGFIMLGEALSGRQWLAISLIVVASAGSAFSASSSRTAVD